MTVAGPRQLVTPFRPIPLSVPAGMAANEFFNSAANLSDLIDNNGLLGNPEGLVLYRKALGHTNEFDTSIIYDTSRGTLDPLERAVRRTQVPPAVKRVWNRMNAVILGFPAEALVQCGEASLDATWPLSAPGVPNIRRLHFLRDGVMSRQNRYSPEVMERAVRLVWEQEGEHGSQWAAIGSIVGKIGCTAEMLRRWLRQAERDPGSTSARCRRSSRTRW